MSGQGHGNRTTSAPGSDTARTAGSPAPARPAGRARAVGLVRPGRRACSRWGRECSVPGHRPDQSAVPDEPALRLVDAAGEPAAVPRPGIVPGGGRRGSGPGWGWLSPRLVVALAILPALMVAGPADLPGGLVRPGARGSRRDWSPCSSGIRPAGGGWLLRSFPACWDWSWSWRGSCSAETGSRSGARPAVPCRPADSPNVLLIVLDTVRADRLSLYGYQRPTTPTLERLAQAGNPLRRGARDRALDARLARQLVHRPLAP